VSGNAFHERRGEEQLGFTVEENVHGFAGIFQVSTLYQNRAAETRMNFPRGGTQVFRCGNFLFRQNFRLVQVRRDERGEREEFFLQHFFRRGFQQPCAAGGNHHRINNQF